MKKIILSSLAILTLLACNNENTETRQSKENVALQIELGHIGQTRSILEGSSLPNNTLYGVFATTTDSPVTNGLVDNGDNRCVTYDSGKSSFDAPVYIPEYKNVFAWAYYPYVETYRAESVFQNGVPMDVESQTDYLIGRSTGSATEDNPRVAVTLNHAMARVHVKVFRSEYNYRDYTFSSLEFIDLYAKGFARFEGYVNYDKTTLASLSLTPAKATLDEVNQTVEVDLLVIPSSEQDIKLQLHGTLEKMVTLPSRTYRPGEQYNIDVVINHEEQLQVGSWYITAWQEIGQDGMEFWKDDKTD